MTTFLTSDVSSTTSWIPTDEQQESLRIGRKSRIFLGRDPSGLPVVIKQLYSEAEFLMNRYHPQYVEEIFSSPDRSCSLARTALTAGKKLHHPHIMKIYNQFLARTKDGQLHSCISQEYIDGKSLEMIPDRSISRKMAIRYTVQLINALQYALSKQLIHFDCTDEHVMIGKRGIKLVALESFEKIPAGFAHDANNREYILSLYETFFGVLEKGQFTSSESSFMLKRLQKLVSPKKSPTLEEKITAKSLPFISSALEKVKKTLVRYSRVASPLFRRFHPLERLQYRLFQHNQAKKQQLP